MKYNQQKIDYKPFLAFILFILQLGNNIVSAHGYLKSPTMRPISAEFKANLPLAMETLPDLELQRYPFEFLSQTFANARFYYERGIYTNPCRGIPQPNTTPPNAFKLGQTVLVSWQINARHPGFCTITLFRKDGSKQELARIDPCGTLEGTESTQITIPNNLGSDCNLGRNCFIQWYWKTRSNDEEYANCADFYIDSNNPTQTTIVLPTSTQTVTNTPITKTIRPITTSTSTSTTTTSTSAEPTNDTDDDHDHDHDHSDDDGEEEENSSGTSCNNSIFQKCLPSRLEYLVCSNGKWIKMPVAPGTKCQQNGAMIILGYLMGLDFHAREHRERSQPERRQKWGLLEKHKDYVIRAKNYHSKQDRLKKLREKALNRNPDEFYFKMIKSQCKDGKHFLNNHIDREKEKYPEELLRTFTTQDLAYVAVQQCSAKKQIESIQESLSVALVKSKSNDHLRFEEDCNSSFPHEDLSEKLENTKIKDKKSKTEMKLLKQLEATKEKARKLKIVANDLSLKKSLQTKGRRTKIGVDSDGIPVYKWKAIRKR